MFFSYANNKIIKQIGKCSYVLSFGSIKRLGVVLFIKGINFMDNIQIFIDSILLVQDLFWDGS